MPTWAARGQLRGTKSINPSTVGCSDDDRFARLLYFRQLKVDWVPGILSSADLFWRRAMKNSTSRVAAVVLMAGMILAAAAAHATTYYVATTGSDSNACSATAKCLSLSRAYSVAAGGDTIEVAGGSYKAQSIPKRSLGTSVVTFRPAAGETVTLAGLSITASYVEIDDITLSSTGGLTIGDMSQSDTTYTNHVTIRNMSGQTMFIVGQNITMYGGSWGGFNACNSSAEDIADVYPACPNGTCQMSSKYITFDGVTFHDVSDNGNQCSGAKHVDCLQFLGGEYVTVRNSRFYNCATTNMILRPYQNALASNVTIENNFLQDTIDNGGISLNIGSGGDTISGTNTIRYNSGGSMSWAPSSGTVSVVGNAFATGACQSNVSYSYNVWTPSWSASCGSNAKKANPTFVGPIPTPALNAVAPNYHLASTDTVARGAGSSTSYPATDIDGQTRTSPPDAGADQITTGSTATKPDPPTNVQAIVN